MLGAIYIGLSGMNAYSKGLQTISNNVANLNSPGFKTTSISFTDMFSYGGGGLTFSTGANIEQSGNGVRYAEPRIDFGQGDLRQSNGDLDLAIQGNGFLVLLDGDKTYYARTGQFVVDEDGYISLQGTKHHLAILYEAGQPTALNLDLKRTKAPTASTKITFADNLTADVSSVPSTGVVVSNIAVYDSLGGKQVWQVTLKPKGAGFAGEWTVEIKNQLGQEIGEDFTIKFLTGGIIDSSSSQHTVTHTAASGGSLSVLLDFSSVSSFSQGSTSTLRASDVDGSAVGTLTSVTVTEEGKIKLAYSNEDEEVLGAVALADFRDPQDLKRVGTGLFENTGNAEFRLRASAQDGIGKLMSKQIEASNVDLSQEFGDLILIQRGFQASSQVVSVSNDMIQQLFGIRGQG